MRTLIRFIHLLPVLLCLALQNGLARADEQSHYDRIHLAVEEVAEVTNDTLVAVLYVQREGSDLAVLANAVNQQISQAIKQSKRVAGIQVQTLDYQTYPKYQKQQLIGWQVRQSLQLKSQDRDALSGLLGELQNKLAVQSISYTVSPQERARVEDMLIGKAVAAFQNRASQITTHLGRKGYRLVSMQVNTDATPIVLRQQRGDLPMAMMEAKVAAPSMEPGTQEITVTVSGVIELKVE